MCLACTEVEDGAFLQYSNTWAHGLTQLFHHNMQSFSRTCTKKKNRCSVRTADTCRMFLIVR